MAELEQSISVALPVMRSRPVSQQARQRPDMTGAQSPGAHSDMPQRPVSLPPTERVLSADPRHGPGVRRRVEFTRRLRLAVLATEKLEDEDEQVKLAGDLNDFKQLKAREAKLRRKEDRDLKLQAAERTSELRDLEYMTRYEQRRGLSRHIRQVVRVHEEQEQQAALRVEDARASERKRLLDRARYHENRMQQHTDGIRKEEDQRQEHLKEWRKKNDERLRTRHQKEEEEKQQKLKEHEERRENIRNKQLQVQRETCGKEESRLREKRVELDKKRVQAVEDAWGETVDKRNAVSEQWDRLILRRVLPKELEALRDGELHRRSALIRREATERLEQQRTFRAGFALKWERMKQSRRQAGGVRTQLAKAAEQMLSSQRAEDRARQRRQRQQEREVEHATRILVKIEEVQGLRQQRMEAVADARAHTREDRRARQLLKRSGVIKRKKKVFEASERDAPPVNWIAVMESYNKPLR
eukprot:Hpha_TRINITY_DN23453_c0_g1::TRINITY_DN23453_c0_g1_i1::g.114013::m.114013